MKGARLKGAYTHCIIPLTQNARKYKLTHSHRAPAGAGVGGALRGGARKLWGAVNAFVLFFVVKVSHLYICQTLSKTAIYTCTLYFL